jgi:hypothetical protein
MIKGEAGAPTHALRVVGWDADLRAAPVVMNERDALGNVLAICKDFKCSDEPWE